MKVHLTLVAELVFGDLVKGGVLKDHFCRPFCLQRTLLQNHLLQGLCCRSSCLQEHHGIHACLKGSLSCSLCGICSRMPHVVSQVPGSSASSSFSRSNAWFQCQLKSLLIQCLVLSPPELPDSLPAAQSLAQLTSTAIAWLRCAAWWTREHHRATSINSPIQCSREQHRASSINNGYVVSWSSIGHPVFRPPSG